MPRLKTRSETKLLDFVDRYLKEHDRWVDNKNRPEIDDDYAEAIEEMLSAFVGGDIPSDCRELAATVEILDAEYDAFCNRANQRKAYPAESFWRAFESFRAAREGSQEEPLPPLPTIAQLRAEQVPDWQIAKLLGMVPTHDLLYPQKHAHLVQKELDAPGSVMDPGKGWCDPRLRERNEHARAVEEKHEALLAKKHGEHKEADSWSCPFTIEELIAQGVGDEQTAKMHDVDVEVVAAARRELEQSQADKSKPARVNRRTAVQPVQAVPSAESAEAAV